MIDKIKKNVREIVSFIVGAAISLAATLAALLPYLESLKGVVD